MFDLYDAFGHKVGGPYSEKVDAQDAAMDLLADKRRGTRLYFTREDEHGRVAVIKKVKDGFQYLPLV